MRCEPALPLLLTDRRIRNRRWQRGHPAGSLFGVRSEGRLPFVWDFTECNPWADSSGNWDGALNWVTLVLDACVVVNGNGQVENASAAAHPLPDGSIHAVITDPPYYDAVPYSYLSDFFYVWLRRSIGSIYPVLLKERQVPKDAEIVVDRPHELSQSTKDIAFYERELTRAFAEGRRILRQDRVAVIVFASKTTASWEAILQAVVDAGWTITGSWPIDTEREARVSAQGQACLGSSVHLVCRPRVGNIIGDWRDVLSELPVRMHEWMPRLVSEGVVAAARHLRLSRPRPGNLLPLLQCRESERRNSPAWRCQGSTGPSRSRRLSVPRLGRGLQGSPLDHLPRSGRLRPRTGRPPDRHVAVDPG